MKTTIYKVILPETCCELLLPSANDIKLLLLDNEELLDMLILKKIDILTENVDKNSQQYKTALANQLIQVK